MTYFDKKSGSIVQLMRRKKNGKIVPTKKFRRFLTVTTATIDERGFTRPYPVVLTEDNKGLVEAWYIDLVRFVDHQPISKKDLKKLKKKCKG